MLEGLWYTVAGFNPLYDCYDCQKLTFEVENGQIKYYALFDAVLTNGTEIWPTAFMSGEDVSNPGRLELDGIDNGLPDHQEWNVMLLTDDTMVVYYCGNILD